MKPRKKLSLTLLFILISSLVKSQVLPADSMALVDFYNSTDGANWSNNDSWLQPSQDVGTWYGITITGNRVTGIDLSWDGGSDGNNLVGSIPPEIGNLTALEQLNLNFNDGLGGSGIPMEIWALSQLNFLALGYCQLGGGLPVEIGDPTNLVHLNLEGNGLSGPIPIEITSLSNLNELLLGENDIGGNFPLDLTTMTSLQNISLRSCQLDGSIPTELNLLTSLQYLDLSTNGLTGNIPLELADITSLMELRLGDNDLDGSIPTELSMLTNLTSLSLFANNFSGTIPTSLGSLTNLQELDLRTNQLTGSIPSELSQLSSLYFLMLAQNQLSGSIPSSFDGTNFPQLNWMALGNNQLDGTIPTGLGTITTVVNLGMSNNNLTGAVPISFQGLVNVDRFNISSNQLDGLPDLTAMSAVTFFNVSNNQFDFADIEPNVGIAGIDFSNQNPPSGGTQVIAANPGDNVSLDATQAGLNNVYAWFKDGQLLEGITTAVLNLNPFAMEDGGKYQAVVTNTVVPDLEISSQLFDINASAPSGTPTNLVATPNETGVTLTWTDNSYNENAWEIQRNLFGTFTTVEVVSFDTLNTLGATLTIDFPAPGNASMSYRIAAVNDTDKSAFSNEASVDVGLLEPWIRSVASNCPGVDVTIQDVNMQSNPATGGSNSLIIQRSLDSLTGYTTIETIESTENMGRPIFSDLTIADNTTYFYRVAAQTGDGNTTTAFSEGMRIDFTNCDPIPPNPLEPASIRDAMAISTTQALIWFWGNENYNIGDQVVIERAETAIGNFIQVISIELTADMLKANDGAFTYVDEGLTPNVDYDYRAFTQNMSETTSPGDIWTVTPEPSDFEVLDVAALNAVVDSQGIGWADYDLDGYEDLFITTFISNTDANLKNILLRNIGGTDLVDVSALTGIDDGVLGRTGNWGDYNGDGLIDLFVADANSTLGDLLYFNNGDVTFRKSEPQFFQEFSNALRGHMTGSAVDVDNDGDLDISVTGVFTSEEFVKLYINNGDETFTPRILSDRADWGWSGVWGDYDNDNDMDLFVGTNSTTNYLFDNVDGEMVINESSVVANDQFNSRGSSWADYDNDGDLDLYVAANFGQGTNRLYRNDGVAGFVSTSGIGLDAANGTRAIVWEDFDNDGNLDLYTAQAGNQFLFYNNGDGTFTEEVGVIPRNFAFVTGASSGDFDNDGKRDLLIASTIGGVSPLLYLNKHSNSNNYVDIKLVGTVSNSTAIGAKIRARTGSTWQMRQIVNLTGANGQNSLIAHFGLGTATVVDSLVVEWPSGQLSTLSNVTTNQLLTIIEDANVATNTAPVAIGISTPFTYNDGDNIELQAIDAEDNPLDFNVTLQPANGTLTSVGGTDSIYTFTPSPGLTVNQLYNDSIKFIATEEGGGLVSNEATILFNFFVSDGPHEIDTITFAKASGDFALSWIDNTLNDSYTVEVTYIDLTDPGNPVERTLVSSDFAIGTLSTAGNELTLDFSTNATADPFLFTATSFFVNVTVSSPSGQSSTDGFVINTATGGRIGASEDGLFFAFGGRSSVPENETVNLKLMAIEGGEFSLTNSNVEIISSPFSGAIGTSVLVKQTDNIYIWDLPYTSTSDLGGLDSIQFQINHNERQIQEVAWATVEIVDVNDPPNIATIGDRTMQEDGTLDLLLDIDDPDSDVTIEIDNTEADISTSVSGNVLSITASNDFNGEAAINVLVNDGVFSTLESFSLVVEPVNDAPEIVLGTTNFTVLEDNRLNLPVFADDPEQSTAIINFSANSNDPTIATASFDLNLLSVDPVLNANGPVEITLFADDGTGTATAVSDPVVITVDYTPVNDAPSVINELPLQNLVEGQPDITIDLSQHFFDPESSSLTYSVSGNSGLTASVTGNTATIGITGGFTGADILNFQAFDGELTGEMQTPFAVSALSGDITVASPPSNLNLNEDFTQQTIDISGVFSSTNPLTYSITGGSLSNVSISGTDMIVTSLQDISGLEEITLVATDQTASQFVSFDIDITAVNDPPSINDLQFVLSENTADSEVLGKVAATDVDSGTITYAITGGNTNSAFDIDANSGEISVNNSAALNYESITIFSLTVSADDGEGGVSNATITVDLIDVDESPIISTTGLSVSELSSVGTVVGTIAATNPLSDALTYTLLSGTSNFQLNGSTGQITVNNATLDFESTPKLPISVQVANADASTSKTIIIDLVNVNESPSLTNQNFTIRENSGTNAFVGLLQGEDPEDNTLNYSITAGNTGSTFSLSGAGILTVSNSALLDFETTQSFSLTISVGDGSLSSSAQVDIAVTNANESPTFNGAVFSISEDAVVGTVIGTVTGADIDGDGLTYSIIDGDESNAFAINATTGQIAVNNSAAIVFATTPKFELNVQASDGSLGASDIVTVNVEEAPAPPLGLEEELFESLLIYPVPAENEITVSFGQNAIKDVVDIRLIDVAGKTISQLYHGKVSGSFIHTFNLAGIETGIYFLHVQIGDETDKKTIMIRK